MSRLDSEAGHRTTAISSVRQWRCVGLIRLALLSFFCVACALNLARFRLDVLRASPDRAANVDERFEALRRELSGRARVGYITDPIGDQAERYFLAQLALTPIVVDLGSSSELVVGDFRTSGTGSIPSDLTLLRDFGNGVVLFRRR